MAGVSDFEMCFDVKVTGPDKVILQMQTLLPEVRAALETVIKSSADQILGRAQQLASDDVIQVRTGAYLRSIESRVRSSDKGVFGYVWSSDPGLAAVFEFGGTQAPREILPNVAQVLRFTGSAGEVFASVVHRPSVVYQPKPIIHAAFDESINAVETQIGDALVTGLDRAGLGKQIESGASSAEYKAE